jgi:hypothetical protein
MIEKKQFSTGRTIKQEKRRINRKNKAEGKKT